MTGKKTPHIIFRYPGKDGPRTGPPMENEVVTYFLKELWSIPMFD